MKRMLQLYVWIRRLFTLGDSGPCLYELPVGLRSAGVLGDRDLGWRPSRKALEVLTSFDHSVWANDSTCLVIFKNDGDAIQFKLTIDSE